jgi:hypothetical protein
MNWIVLVPSAAAWFTLPPRAPDVSGRLGSLGYDESITSPCRLSQAAL